MSELEPGRLEREQAELRELQQQQQLEQQQQEGAVHQGKRARAMGKATHLLGRASALAAPHQQLNSVSSGLNKAQGYLAYYNPYSSSSSSAAAAASGGGGAASRERASDVTGQSPYLAPASNSSNSRLKYFTSSAKAARDAANYTEERCVSFPGYAVVRHPQTSSSKKPGVPQVECEVSGYVFRTRPVSQASRTQKAFVKLAQQLAGVKKPRSSNNNNNKSPSLPSDHAESSPPPSASSSTSSFNTSSSASSRYVPSSGDHMLADLLKLSDQNANDEDIEKALKDLHLGADDSASDAGSTLSTPVGSSSDLAGLAKQQSAASDASSALSSENNNVAPISPRQVRSYADLKRPSPPTTPRRSQTAGPQPPSPLTSMHPTSKEKEQSAPPSSSLANLDLETDAAQMYNNLQDRLRAFFSQKLDQRRIRLAVYLEQEGLPESELRCLARGTVTSTLGGGFKQIVTFPAILSDTQQNLQGAWLRITTELLPMEEDSTDAAAPGRVDRSHAKVLPANIPRVISDIDDTVKVSEVLGGARRVFRNVFALPYERIIVHGMSDWYNTMAAKGAGMHYVSNGPWELTEVVRRFMSAADLPHGQLRLKEYMGGSLLSGMWESAAGRKRQNVVSVLSTFPESKFILVGDSGEQDLELYTEVARSNPGRILGIFIRDVSSSGTKSPVKSDTSKVKPAAGQPLSDSTSDPLSPNNPLQTMDYSERRIGISLWRRLTEAEAQLPDGCMLRTFKTGHEVAKDAIEMVDQVMHHIERDTYVLPGEGGHGAAEKRKMPPPPLPPRMSTVRPPTKASMDSSTPTAEEPPQHPDVANKQQKQQQQQQQEQRAEEKLIDL